MCPHPPLLPPSPVFPGLGLDCRPCQCAGVTINNKCHLLLWPKASLDTHSTHTNKYAPWSIHKGKTEGELKLCEIMHSAGTDSGMSHLSAMLTLLLDAELWISNPLFLSDCLVTMMTHWCTCCAVRQALYLGTSNINTLPLVRPPCSRFFFPFYLFIFSSRYSTSAFQC